MTKVIQCDKCGKVIPTYARPYGSWYTGVTWTVSVGNNTGQGFLPNEWHFCENCYPAIRQFFDSLRPTVTEGTTDE